MRHFLMPKPDVGRKNCVCKFEEQLKTADFCNTMEKGGNFKLAISCGGTGGHFYPGLALAKTLNTSGEGEALLLLSGIHASGQALIAAAAGVRAAELPLMPDPRKAPLRFLPGLLSGFAASMRELRSADALLCMGSFAGLPPFLAAKFRRKRIYLHDGNARIGRANRIMSRFAEFIGTAFPAVNRDAVKCRCETVGMPLRPELLNAPVLGKAAAVEEINRHWGTTFDAGEKLLLVFGGSLGAAVFNETLPATLDKTPFRQVIHLCGRGNAGTVEQRYGGKVKLLCLDSSERMDLFYSAADMIVSRSGGSTVAELLYFGKNALLVPYRYAAEGHQTDNARHFAAASGMGDECWMDNTGCTPENLAVRLNRCFESGLNGFEPLRGNAAEKIILHIKSEICGRKK